MAAPRQIVVHSTSGLRPEFSAPVAEWINEGVVFLGIVGLDAAKLEDVADDVAVGQSASALSFVFFGFLCCYVWVRASAAKGWSVLSPHIDKQSIIARLEALEP